MTATTTTIADTLKELYDGQPFEDLVIDKEPVLALLPKETDGGGSIWPLPMMYAPTAGVSPDFAAAQASKAGASYERWEITWKDLFSLFSISHKAMATSRGSAKSFVDLIERETEAAIKSFQKVVGKAVFGNGGGAIAQIASGGGTDTLTLTNREDMVIFDVNMQVESSTTDGTSGSSLGDIEKITAVNRQSKTITQAGTWDPTNYTANNYIFLRGGFGNWIGGLKGWLPDSAPSSAPWYGVDRTTDSRFDAVRKTADPNVDSNLVKFIMSLAAEIGLEGGEPDICVVNTLIAAQIAKILDNKCTYERMVGTNSMGKEVASAGFDAIVVHTEVGKIKVVSSRNCPQNRMYMLQTDTWVIKSVGPLGDFLTYGDDTDKFRAHSAENAAEARFGAYFNMACRAPVYNGVGKIDSLIQTV